MEAWNLWGRGRSQQSVQDSSQNSAQNSWAASLGIDFAALGQRLDAWRSPLESSTPPRILLMARDPGEFIAGLVFANGLAQRSPLWLFLGNPDWAIAEKQRVIEQVQPTQIWSDRHNPWRGGAETIHNAASDFDGGSFLTPERSYVAIATGGSSGQIRFAMHTWSSLRNSVGGFCDYFGGELDGGRVHSFCTLPLFHVSGLMQFLRCAWSDGVFQLGKLPKNAEMPKLCWHSESSPAGFISLVPTQLARLLETPSVIAWLRQFRVILLGGAPAWADLLGRSRHLQLPLAPTYGMTETAAQVATLKPVDFLAGKTGVGRLLPHVALKIGDGSQELGAITIQTPALAAGYWRGAAIAPYLATGDLGQLDDDGYLSILGRRDDVIITGGENVIPQEVEAAILATGLAADVCVVGVPDGEWGQRVAAAWVPKSSHIPTAVEWRQALGDRLSRYKHPKLWRSVRQIPRNSRGKLNRSAIAAWLLSELHDSR
ncbi:MAG: AMP-binding protein [Cyanobacteria bacterium P01_D01_bin.73]